MPLKVHRSDKDRKARPSLRLTASLNEVVRRVGMLLSSGEPVIFVGRRFHKDVSSYGVVNKYAHKIESVRVAPSGVLLQVKFRVDVPISMGWSTLFSTEKLLSASGEVLYESPDFEEVEEMLSGDYFDAIVSDLLNEIGVMPWERKTAVSDLLNEIGVLPWEKKTAA